MDAAARGLHEDAAREALDPIAIARRAGLAPGQVEVVVQAGSTNEELMGRPLRDDVPGRACVLIAVRQTAGRGRRGRAWLSEPADSLTLSVSMTREVDPAAPPLGGLSIALGVAVAEFASAFSDGIALKWPNDLLRHGRKAAGILVESRRDGGRERVVAGVGLNLRLAPQVAAALDQPATGLFDAGRDAPPRAEVAGALVAALVAALTRFLERGFGDVRERWRRFDGLEGREVVVLGPAGSRMAGRALGIDGTGALRVATPDGEIAVVAGDVSVRAAPGEGR